MKIPRTMKNAIRNHTAGQNPAFWSINSLFTFNFDYKKTLW